KFFTMLVTFTMFFSGGMIPLYLTVKQFGMMDTIWALVLPGAISTYNMIVIRTAFQSIPDSLIESAQLDGANDLIILWKIVVPLSKATLATMLLFYAVTHWNSYFDAMLYINKKEMYPLQIMLRNMLIGGLFNEETAIAGANADSFAVTDATLRSAAIIVTTLPILVVYPFVQRYFVKGVMIGGVKG
ncbi:MAG: carbohydrate ABC transporter permease, partial [Aristaeellaceae bacterium]